MLGIYTYDIRNLLNNDEYETRLKAASSYRLNKINIAVSPAKAREHLAASAVLDEALKKIGLREKEIEYGFGEVGKPYIKRICRTTDSYMKNWEKIHFNISHSGDYVVCAISDREVGVDIQKIEGLKLQVAKRFFTQSEYEQILNQPDEKKMTEAFYRIWTLKESFVKSSGMGTNLPFDTFEFDISLEKVCLRDIAVCENDYGIGKVKVQDYTFEELKLSQTRLMGKCEDEHYKLAVCIAENLPCDRT